MDAFEYERIHTCLPQEALFTRLALQRAHHLFQGVAQYTSEGGALVFREGCVIFKHAGKMISAENHCHSPL